MVTSDNFIVVREWNIQLISVSTELNSYVHLTWLVEVEMLFIYTDYRLNKVTSTF